MGGQAAGDGRQGQEMIKNVVFDVGKVLVDFDWQGLFRELGFSQEAYDKVAEATVHSVLWNEFDRGKMADEEILKGFLGQAPGCEDEVMRFWDNLGSSIKCYDYTLPWIRGLRANGFSVYLLSNFPRRLYFQSIEELAFVEEADGAVFSYEARLTKPEPEIYEALLKKYKLDPTECVFLDDTRDNIVAANKLGMATILFRTKSQAEEELRNLGIRS